MRWFVELGLLLGGMGVLWMASSQISDTWHRRKQRREISQGVLSIVDSKHRSLWDRIDKMEMQTCITPETFITVKDALAKMHQQGVKEIHVVIHTFGGSLSAAEAISRALLLMRKQHQCHLKAYIPYYAYSAGCLIALACQEIHMSSAAFLGPADAQNSENKSIKSISDTVEWQLDNCSHDKIKAEWYSKYLEAKATRIRQREWMDELVASEIFTKEVGDKLYEELFSGKYNHDQVIHPEWAKKIGVPVIIDDQMPDFVGATLSFHEAKTSE